MNHRILDWVASKITNYSDSGKKKSVLGVRDWAVEVLVVGESKKNEMYLEEIFFRTNPLATPAATWIAGLGGSEYCILKSSSRWLTSCTTRLRITGPIPTHPSSYPSNPPCFQGSAQHPPQNSATNSCWVNECHRGDYSEVAITCPRPHSQVFVVQALNMKHHHRRNVFSMNSLSALKVESFQVWKKEVSTFWRCNVIKHWDWTSGEVWS